MTSLYKRATPRQQRILRAVEGAYKNACDAHPKHRFDRRFARSIAKRATGTLTAQWPDVLAASAPSRKSQRETLCIAQAPGRQALQRPERERAQDRQALPPKFFRLRVGAMAGAARRAGQTERHAALVEVLRLLATLTARETP